MGREVTRGKKIVDSEYEIASTGGRIKGVKGGIHLKTNNNYCQTINFHHDKQCNFHLKSLATANKLVYALV